MDRGSRKAARRAAAGVAAAALALTAAAAQAQESGAAAASSVTEIMKAMTIPGSNAVWDVGRNPPRDEAAWQALRNRAVLLAESGNLLLLGGRAKDDAVWRKTARMMAASGAAALRAAKARDADGVAAAGNLAVDACEMCHERHWQR